MKEHGLKKVDVKTVGKRMVIDFVDTGIPTDPRSSENSLSKHILFLSTFSGICEVTLDFPSRSCNMNLVVVSFILQHLLQPGGYLMQLRPILLLLMVVVMERNHGIPVIVTGHNFGNIS